MDSRGSATARSDGEMIATDRLRDLAATEKASERPRRSLPPPPGAFTIDPRAAGGSGSDAAGDAQLRRTLAEVVEASRSSAALSALLVSAPAEGGEVGVEAGGEAGVDLGAAKLDAASKYAEGRLLILDGRYAEAAEALAGATRLDPRSAVLWLELAEAQRLAGRRSLARDGYEQAVRLGSPDALPLWRLGREALQDRRYNTAEGMLLEAYARTVAAKPASGESARGDDPLLGHIIAADLAQALERGGRLLAARDALLIATDLPETVQQTSIQAELAELYRRRVELRVRAADLSLRLGDFDSADAQYSAAAVLRPADASTMLGRRIYTKLVQGRDAGACVLLLDQLSASPGRVDDAQIGLVRYLAAQSELRNELGDAIVELGGVMSEGAPASARARMLRAAAAASRTPEGVLRRAVAIAPSDAGTLTEWLDSFGSDSGRRVSALAELVGRRPDLAPSFADVWLLAGRGIEDGLSQLARERSTAAALLRAYAVARLGDPVEGLRILAPMSVERTPAESPSAAALARAVLVARAEIGVAAGRWPDAEQAAAELSEAASSVEELIAAGRALRAVQDSERAASVVRRAVALAADGLGFDDVLLAADVLQRSGDAGVAAELFGGAATLDPGDERAYAALIALFAPSGPLASEARLGEIARRLRASNPSSRVIRLIAARDAAQRSQFIGAESNLRDLVAQAAPPDAVATDLLASVWERMVSADATAAVEKLAWIDERLAARPESQPLFATRIRLLAASGQAERALAALDERLARRATPELAQLRERVLRGPLGRPADADAAAYARLRAAPPNLENSLELGRVLAERGEIEEAVSVVVSGLPLRAKLTAEQNALVIRLLTQLPLPDVAGRANAEAYDTGAAIAASRLFDLVTGSKAEIPMSLQIKRLRIATIATPDDPAKLYKLGLDVAAAAPKAPAGFFGAVLDEIVAALGGSSQPRRAIAMLRYAAEQAPVDSSESSGVGLDVLLRVWYGRLVALGNAEDAETFVRFSESRNKIASLFNALGRDQPALAAAQARAELAYRIASGMTTLGREADAEQVLRLALRDDPEHGFANNDLGYSLVERGERLDEAERMLLIAIRVLPDRGSVNDSLGWLRYKQGRLEDSRDAATGAVVEGAITLLKRAGGFEDAEDDPVIRDHLGDALWRVGRRDEAVVAWREALRAADINLPAINQIEGATMLQALYSKTRDSVRRKLDAAGRGEEPPVAPVVGR